MNAKVLLLPLLSVAVYVTVVVPIPKVSPDEKSDPLLATPQLSVIKGEAQLAIALQDPGSL